MAKVKLSAVSTSPPGKISKEKLKAETVLLLKQLDELQNLLIAGARHSLLVIIQGMDASGKDGVLRNVFGSLNPLGVSVKSFKVPTAEELSHDFLWRVHKDVPPKGMIRIFNRSHYEDVLVTRVHGWCDEATARKRMKAINDFEQLLLDHNQTRILKFYLHVSKEEQHRRLTERTHDPRKMWKYNERDFEEAKLWKQYMKYYEDCFEQCSKVPWHIIPSDQNWYKEYLITKEVVSTLKQLKMQYPGLKK
jgi:PPK2 family polyphosphate:nucleotide phosphotransferase